MKSDQRTFTEYVRTTEDTLNVPLTRLMHLNPGWCGWPSTKNTIRISNTTITIAVIPIFHNHFLSFTTIHSITWF